MSILNNSLHIRFNVDQCDWIFLSLHVTLFGYTMRAALSLRRWYMNAKVKPWAVRFSVGPFSLNLIDECKLDAHIQKVLSENEDDFYSES